MGIFDLPKNAKIHELEAIEVLSGKRVCYYVLSPGGPDDILPAQRTMVGLRNVNYVRVVTSMPKSGGGMKRHWYDLEELERLQQKKGSVYGTGESQKRERHTSDRVRLQRPEFQLQRRPSR